MFADRAAAGRALVPGLESYRGQNAIVLALPRGGLPVASEVALALALPLDLMLVRKVGVPHQPELAVAAIAGPEGGVVVINDAVARMAGLDAQAIERLARPERAELARRRLAYLGGRAVPDLAGRTVILVDDGAATGATMRAAIRAARALGAARVVVALPTAAADTLAQLRAEAEDVVCLTTPFPFIAVGGQYRDFPQLSDAEVIQILSRHGAAHDPGPDPSRT